ncbi:MAG: C39 family peptidase [Myxococcales bacterium]|nr:C39 family peptidase [Myxococcales bacterium]
MRRRGWLAPTLVALLVGGCADGVDDADTVEALEPFEDEAIVVKSSLDAHQRLGRFSVIRAAASSRGMTNAYLLAGIAITETELAQCWSEAQWACQGPNSPDCGGGPVIAGASDGPCHHREGGLGLFQFDAGTHAQTLNRYGNGILTVDGQIGAAIDYVVNMVKISAYTTNAETDAKARAWLNAFDVNDPVLRDQWIKTVLRYYNGCQPGWRCWAPRYETYSNGMWTALDEPGGLAFWGPPAGPDGVVPEAPPPAAPPPPPSAGTRCGDSPLVVGAIEERYLRIGGCDSPLGAPVSEELAAPDGVGRVSRFDNGVIYWTPETGAFEVYGQILEKWREHGAETGILGYPIKGETAAPGGDGRYSVFERGSIYWTPTLGAHEVHGMIRDKWKETGWEAGDLGYPISDEYAVPEGRRSDFEGGSITWHRASATCTVDLANGPGWKVLDIDFQIQQTGYWCGPAATHNALSARRAAPSQQQLANELPTTRNGTDWIGQITGVLNHHLDGNPYLTTEMPNDPPTPAQRDRLWMDIVTSIDNNYPVVANIVAPAHNHPPGYPNYTIYHYFTVIGYNADTAEVFIADSANFGGNTLYWLSFDQLATLIPPKGYSAFRP